MPHHILAMQSPLLYTVLSVLLQADARKMLVLDINELRYRQEDLLLQQQAANQYASGEDPTTLKIALRLGDYLYRNSDCCMVAAMYTLGGTTCSLTYRLLIDVSNQHLYFL